MTSTVLEKASKLYSMLQDDISKDIFLKKLEYAVTQNSERIVYDCIKEHAKNFNAKIEALRGQNRKVIIYGAGVNLQVVLMLCKDISIYAICDKDKEKQKRGYDNYRIISPEELYEKHLDAVVLVSTTTYYNEVMEELRCYFKEENLLALGEEWTMEWMESQYFEPGIMHLEDGEVFVDCGCFDFGTSRLLMEKCKAAKIYAFEPDEENYQKVEDAIKSIESDCEIALMKTGLWDSNTQLSFYADGTMCSYVTEDGGENGVVIDVVSLDEVIKDKVTFIKMDIEGSELKALQGAEQLIRRYRPKLAISIYHKPEDTIDIPWYIHQLVPEYKFYIRHYSYSAAETVLYAMI